MNRPSLIPPGDSRRLRDARFPDVSDGLGIDVNDLAGGVIVDDFDNDGNPDLVISAWDLNGQIRFFRNNSDGTFTQRTSEAGLVGKWVAEHPQTDYNNDGFDIYGRFRAPG